MLQLKSDGIYHKMMKMVNSCNDVILIINLQPSRYSCSYILTSYVVDSLSVTHAVWIL